MPFGDCPFIGSRYEAFSALGGRLYFARAAGSDAPVKVAGEPGSSTPRMARKVRRAHSDPLIDGVGMDLYLSNDELAHLRIIAQRQDGPIETRITDRLCLIGLIAPTPAGWELTPEGWLAVETIESA